APVYTFTVKNLDFFITETYIHSNLLLLAVIIICNKIIPIRFQKLCFPCLFSVGALFKRFQRFGKSLYGLKNRSLKANWY
ncbi:MAG: hypothetical protein BWK80_39950, partial [Desulfobacteraceae bacterium IS3]